MIFKNASGAWLLKQLFFEYADTDRTRVLYTTKRDDHEGFPSFPRLYLEMADESEYDFANLYFGGWPHWKRLQTCGWFNDHLSEVREELQVRLSAENLVQIRAKARSGDLGANKYLLEQGWKPRSSVGRPTKERIRQEAQKITQDQSAVSDDLSRLLDGATFQ